MEFTNKANEEKLERARKRVKEIKGFYWHLAIYLAINGMSLIANFSKSMWDTHDFNMNVGWFFWGIGLAFHAYKVFGVNPFFGKEWEKREIEKVIEKERKEIQKFK